METGRPATFLNHRKNNFAMAPSLHEVEELAKQAGEILRAGFGNIREVQYKGAIDLVTDVDKRAEKFLIGYIQKHYPHHRIVAEESGETSGDGGSVWFIDPLDGTINYAHGIPIFSVSIGYMEGDNMRLGVVYDPSRDECFSAERGQGACLNGKPLKVSTETHLDRSLLVTGFPYDIRTTRLTNLEQFAKFSLKSQAVRRLGSAAIDLSYVAAGRFDGYWEYKLSPWDVAAGVLIAEEGGAKVTNIEGGPLLMTPSVSLICANAQLHAQLLGQLNEAQ